MDRFMEQFYIQPSAADLLRRFAATELRGHKLAAIIRKQMRMVFSHHTLGLFDKKYALNGGNHVKLQIPAITRSAINELLGRDLNEILDNTLVDSAWRCVFAHGLLPIDNVKH